MNYLTGAAVNFVPLELTSCLVLSELVQVWFGAFNYIYLLIWGSVYMLPWFDMTFYPFPPGSIHLMGEFLYGYVLYCKAFNYHQASVFSEAWIPQILEITSLPFSQLHMYPCSCKGLGRYRDLKALTAGSCSYCACHPRGSRPLLLSLGSLVSSGYFHFSPAP